VPELPEVEALVDDLSRRLDGRAIVRVDIAAFSCLKTYDPPITALAGGMVDGVTRHGKFLDIDVSGTHLVLHLARAGWIRWKDEVPPVPARPNSKSPLAARIVLDNGAGLDVTEAGTRKSLALYVVRDPADVEGIAVAVERVLADPAYARDLALRGKARALELAAGDFGEQMAAVYADLGARR
jgi:formamidopyrimidine-DNA glycosylase